MDLVYLSKLFNARLGDGEQFGFANDEEFWYAVGFMMNSVVFFNYSKSLKTTVDTFEHNIRLATPVNKGKYIKDFIRLKLLPVTDFHKIGLNRLIAAIFAYDIDDTKYDRMSAYTVGYMATKVKNLLGGVKEVADILGIDKRNIKFYTDKPDFPKEVRRLASGPLYNLGEIQEWKDK